MVKGISLFLFFSTLVTSLVLSSCEQSSREAIVIVAVDDLAVDDIACNQDILENSRSGWAVICHEAVRFTHGYTTSTQSVPALASLLTGQYPFQHGLRFNSKQYLSPEVKTMAEVAHDKKWRTSFFSGGAPVLRKTGLNQGFDLFSDNLNAASFEIFRSLGKNIELFKEWLNEESDEKPFLSVFYVPDPSFPHIPTKNEFGEIRVQSATPQLDELDENIFNLIQFLKKNNRWENTTFVLLGLSGHSEAGDRPQTLKGQNLHGENTQVALFYKPGKKLDSKSQSIDFNVNLADVGLTLIKKIISDNKFSIENQVTSNLNPTTASSSESFPIVSLNEWLEVTRPRGTKTDLSLRPILIESAWAEWLGLRQTIPTAVVSDHFLYLFDTQNFVYNLLQDRNEESPLAISELHASKIVQLKKNISEIGFSSENSKKISWQESLLLAAEKSTEINTKYSDMLVRSKEIYNQNFDDKYYLNFSAFLSWKKKDWTFLKKIGEKANNSFLVELSSYESSLVGNKRSKNISHPCFVLASEREGTLPDLKKCEDDFFYKYLLSKFHTDVKGVSFEKYYDIFRYRQKLQEEDINQSIKFNGSFFEQNQLHLFDVFLELPENLKLKNQINKKNKISLDEAI